MHACSQCLHGSVCLDCPRCTLHSNGSAMVLCTLSNVRLWCWDLFPGRGDWTSVRLEFSTNVITCAGSSWIGLSVVLCLLLVLCFSLLDTCISSVTCLICLLCLPPLLSAAFGGPQAAEEVNQGQRITIPWIDKGSSTEGGHL